MKCNSPYECSYKITGTGGNDCSYIMGKCGHRLTKKPIRDYPITSLVDINQQLSEIIILLKDIKILLQEKGK